MSTPEEFRKALQKALKDPPKWRIYLAKGVPTEIRNELAKWFYTEQIPNTIAGENAIMLLERTEGVNSFSLETVVQDPNFCRDVKACRGVQIWASVV